MRTITPPGFAAFSQSTGVENPQLDATYMGTGSDYGAFMQHAGIPALGLNYFGAADGYEGQLPACVFCKVSCATFER